MIIHTIEQYLSEIRRLDDNPNKMAFYRGQTNRQYRLEPPVYRKSAQSESEQYKNIMIKCPEEFKKGEHLSNLAKMQHYGVETRLIDLTINPLVALYFACETHPDTDGCVMVFTPAKSEILHHTSDKALMLACLPLFNDTEQAEIKRFCLSHSGVISDRDIKGNAIMQRFLHEIRSEFPAFETAIVGNDLLKSYFVMVYRDSQRIKVQGGAFVICGLDKQYLNQMEKNCHKIYIDGHSKSNILKDLRRLQIDSSTMYPELENYAKSFLFKKKDWTPVDL